MVQRQCAAVAESWIKFTQAQGLLGWLCVRRYPLGGSRETAKALGINVPQSPLALALANEVIE